MSLYGKLVSSKHERRQERKRPEPIKMPAFDTKAMIKKFDLTLAGRVLNPEAQAHRVKNLVTILPAVWKCEDRVQGLDMGKGKFHFRFKEEADLQKVLENRPYHFDGWMFSLERWVPSIREDFPSTIPFWISIEGIPEFYCYEEGIIEIGEKLGELLKWEWQSQPPRVQVVLEGSRPLTRERELDFGEGVIIKVTFRYERLEKSCKICDRITHDRHHCPLQRFGRHRRAPIRSYGEDEDRRDLRHNRAEATQAEAILLDTEMGRDPRAIL